MTILSLVVSDSLVVDGTLNLGSNDLRYEANAFTDHLEVSQDGVITNGGSFILAVTTGAGDNYTTIGTGVVDAPFNFDQSDADTTTVTFSELGGTRIGATSTAPSGEVGDVIFPNATTISDSLFIANVSALVQFDALTDLNGTLTIGDATANFISNANLTIDGMATIASNNSAQFNGATTFGDDAFFATATTDAFATFANLATFEEDVTLDGMQRFLPQWVQTSRLLHRALQDLARCPTSVQLPPP